MTELTEEELAVADLRVPVHVVYRTFAAETVLLNVRTGRYHGLNHSAGAMLDALERAGTPAGATAELVARFDADEATISAALHRLCRALLSRGLLEIHGDR